MSNPATTLPLPRTMSDVVASLASLRAPAYDASPRINFGSKRPTLTLTLDVSLNTEIYGKTPILTSLGAFYDIDTRKWSYTLTRFPAAAISDTSMSGDQYYDHVLSNLLRLGIVIAAEPAMSYIPLGDVLPVWKSWSYNANGQEPILLLRTPYGARAAVKDMRASWCQTRKCWYISAPFDLSMESVKMIDDNHWYSGLLDMNMYRTTNIPDVVSMMGPVDLIFPMNMMNANTFKTKTWTLFSPCKTRKTVFNLHEATSTNLSFTKAVMSYKKDNNPTGQTTTDHGREAWDEYIRMGWSQ